CADRLAGPTLLPASASVLLDEWAAGPGTQPSVWQALLARTKPAAVSGPVRESAPHGRDPAAVPAPAAVPDHTDRRCSTNTPVRCRAPRWIARCGGTGCWLPAVVVTTVG